MVGVWGFLTSLSALVSGKRPTTFCECCHDRSAHEHYRAGSECGLCGCDQYRRSR
jgi:hypothetical protein